MRFFLFMVLHVISGKRIICVHPYVNPEVHND